MAPVTRKYTGGEVVEQALLVHAAERHGALDAVGQALAVAQQEEQQVQHDGQADQEVEGVAPEVDGVAREHLADLGRAFGQLLFQRGQVCF